MVNIELRDGETVDEMVQRLIKEQSWEQRRQEMERPNSERWPDVFDVWQEETGSGTADEFNLLDTEQLISVGVPVRDLLDQLVLEMWGGDSEPAIEDVSDNQLEQLREAAFKEGERLAPRNTSLGGRRSLFE